MKQWIGCATENFLKGRQGHKPEAVVLHGIASLDAADRLFADPSSAQSCHYALTEQGALHQYVDDTDTAFHAGFAINPSWQELHPGVNPNLYTLGVTAIDTLWPDAQYKALAELLRELADHWHIPLDARHVVLHAEIRASSRCLGAEFDREKLLKLLSSPKTPTPTRAPPAQFVQLIANANLREGAASSRARIVRTLTQGTDVEVVGFTERGERIQGNANWYETSDNAFLWAGNTDRPQPVGPEPVVIPLVAPLGRIGSGGFMECGIAAIDALLSNQTGKPIDSRTGDPEAVGALQDLLCGQGYSSMPSILSSAYGNFGAKTLAAIKDFQLRQNLQTSGALDAQTLRQLVDVPAPQPRATRAYFALVLQIPFRGLQKVLSIVAQMEGVGKFGALNLNTDRAGISYGIIQWAQRPGRLPELLRAFSQADRGLYVQIFGDGDAALADALIAHVSKVNGGVNPKTGISLDARFNLIAPPWTQRFETATLQIPFQNSQVAVALEAFTRSYQAFQRYAPDIVSERAVAFMLDVANQFGDTGLKGLYTQIRRPDMAEMDILDVIADETVERMPDSFKQGVRARRDGFLNSKLLAEDRFEITT